MSKYRIGRMIVETENLLNKNVFVIVECKL